MSLELSKKSHVIHKDNQLLLALPSIDRKPLNATLEKVYLPLGYVLHEPNAPMQYAYFPITAIASLSYIMENGATSEVAMVGNEGVVGISIFMGGDTFSSRALVQKEGYMWRLHSECLKREFARAGPFQYLLLRYTQALLTQIAQTAVCARHHILEQQLCKWLLLNLDRLCTNEIFTTHALIASMLGVRREGVTEAAGNLQRAGLIQYRRGHINVIDRAGLETCACECYALIKKEYNRLLPKTLFPIR